MSSLLPSIVADQNHIRVSWSRSRGRTQGPEQFIKSLRQMAGSGWQIFIIRQPRKIGISLTELCRKLIRRVIDGEDDLAVNQRPDWVLLLWSVVLPCHLARLVLARLPRWLRGAIHQMKYGQPHEQDNHEVLDHTVEP
ncbi:hypothetical protein BU198_09500 [Streptomyces sp. CBMA156]|nr:hypothetical protein [Streptomyces sp. CBMA156]